jgi:hypothetical protein
MELMEIALAFGLSLGISVVGARVTLAGLFALITRSALSSVDGDIVSIEEATGGLRVPTT